MKKKHQTMILSALVAGLAVCGASTWPARGAPVSCGDVLTANTTLQNDIICSGPAALVIGADNITVNLNGHTLRSLDGLGVGVTIAGHNGVTIKNGVIDGFQEAIRAQEASDLTLKDLTIPSISGNGIIPGHVSIVAAIHILGGTRAKIQDSSIAAGPPIICVPSESCPDGVFGPDAILLESVRDVSIKNVHVNGGFSGVNFASCSDELWCPPLTEQSPSTGELKNCTIANNYIGVLLFNAADVTIKENVISGADQGIRAGIFEVLAPKNVKILGNEIFGNFAAIYSQLIPAVPGVPGPIFDCQIKENHVHDNNQGIALVNGQNCTVSENLVENNVRFGIALFTVSSGNKVAENTVTGSSVFFGIGLTRNLANPPLPGPSGNLISENIATGNSAFDLFHSDLSSPNDWKENVYNTKSGADIP